MGLFEFNIWLRESLGERTYDIVRRFYRYTLRNKVEERRLLKSIALTCDIKYPKQLLKKKIKLPHPLGIVIADNDKIGHHVQIAQNVTIGTKNGVVPTIEDNVMIFPNTVVMGDITIGWNSIIGAGSVVMKDIPPHEIWAGNPAKFIKKKSPGWEVVA